MFFPTVISPTSHGFLPFRSDPLLFLFIRLSTAKNQEITFFLSFFVVFPDHDKSHAYANGFFPFRSVPLLLLNV